MKKLINRVLPLLLAALLFSACGSQPASGTTPEDLPPSAEPTATQTAAPTTPTEKVPDYSAYEGLLMGLSLNSSISTYSVYDMDDNGVRELIVKLGDFEAEYLYRFYSLDGENNAVELGTFSGSHSVLYADEEKPGLIHVEGSQGYQVLSYITVANDMLLSSTLERGEIGDGDYYRNGSPLSVCYVTDFSLLEPDAQLIGIEPLAETPLPEPSPTATPEQAMGATPYIEVVGNPDQPIYDGPGYDYKQVGRVTVATGYTIAEENRDYEGNLWGRLKSGAGWIDLTNARSWDGVRTLLTVDFAEQVQLPATYTEYSGGEENYSTQMVFRSSGTLTNLQFVLLDFLNLDPDAAEILFSFSEMGPSMPFVANAAFWGDFTTYGLIATDETGVRHFWTVNESGRNGDLVLREQPY